MLTRWGSDAGWYISPVGSSVLPAGACHPDLCLKQPLPLIPHGICFSYYVELFTLCLFVSDWVPYVLDFVFHCETRLSFELQNVVNHSGTSY